MPYLTATLCQSVLGSIVGSNPVGRDLPTRGRYHAKNPLARSALLFSKGVLLGGFFGFGTNAISQIGSEGIVQL